MVHENLTSSDLETPQEDEGCAGEICFKLSFACCCLFLSDVEKCSISKFFEVLFPCLRRKLQPVCEGEVPSEGDSAQGSVNDTKSPEERYLIFTALGILKPKDGDF